MAKTFFTATHDEVLNHVSESERVNVRVDFHPLRDDEENEGLSGTELTGSTSRSVHVLQLAYREKRTGAIVDMKGVVDPEVSLEKMTEALSVLSDLAEHADKTKGLGTCIKMFNFFIFSSRA